MNSLPKHILKALKENKTSLGEHPSYPPEEEEKFIVNLVIKMNNHLILLLLINVSLLILILMGRYYNFISFIYS